MKHLPATQSDHSPIFISKWVRSPPNFKSPFLISSFVAPIENFHAFVEEKWEKDARLVPALSSLAFDFQSWNLEVFGNILHKKKHLMARMAGIQNTLSIRKDQGLIKLESKLRMELHEALVQEELLWYQKARVEWTNNGDKMPSFSTLALLFDVGRIILPLSKIQRV